MRESVDSYSEENVLVLQTKIFEIILFFVSVCFFQLLTKHEIRKDILMYIAVIVLSLFLISISTIIKGKFAERCLYILGILTLASLYMFRNEIGIDDRVYHNYYDYASLYGFWDYLKWGGIEKGFLITVFILNKLTGGSYFAAQTILSIIPFVFIGKANWKYRNSNSATIATLVVWTHFYPLMMGNGLVRLFIAVSIVYYAFDYIVTKNRFKYILWILIATSFHMSALVMLVLLIMTINTEWFFKHWKIFILSLLLIIPTGLLVVIKILVPRLGSRYMAYSQLGKVNIALGLFDILPVFIMGLIFYKYIDNDEGKKIYIIGLIMCFLSVLISVVSTVLNMSRLIFYANFGVAIVFSMIEKKHLRNIKYYLFVSIIIVYLLFYMYYTGFWNERINSILLPYESYLF